MDDYIIILGKHIITRAPALRFSVFAKQMRCGYSRTI